MTTSLEKRIEQLDDYTVVQIINEYANRVFEGLETTTEDLMRGVTPELKDTELFQKAQTLTPEERDRPLSEAQSAELARELLTSFARDATLAPTLEATLNDYKDERLLVGAILATGVAVSMIIVAATITAKGTVKGIEFEKKAADATLVGAAGKIFSPTNA